jgi:anti-sigma regulatory factor (Ser/Thr protein kinase)
MKISLGKTSRTRLIRRSLLNAIKAGDIDYLTHTIEIFGVTRQAVHRNLSALVDLGFLSASGSTKGRQYSLGKVRSHSKVMQLNGLQESNVYIREFGFVFSDLPKDIDEICYYGFTEMLNNAIDHSDGSEVEVTVDRDFENLRILISDNGEGIFIRIARIIGINDPRESILELSKGKLTTDPENHLGQGIFFTSRAFDKFKIYSGNLVFSHDDSPFDFLFHSKNEHSGTTVVMEIALNSNKILKEIFDEFTGTEDEDFTFNKTVVPVKLALYEGKQLVSRSQAKRILNRVEKFKTVILDFQDVDYIGQGFADEMFRVFAIRNPQIKLIPVNHSEDIKKSIQAAISEK